MARLIGVRPDAKEGYALQFMYQFVMEKLPDYVCASFLPCIPMKDGRIFECDMILLIPHMGVYILEIRNAVGFGYADGNYCYIDKNGRQRVYSSSHRSNILNRQRVLIREYLKEKFNLAPLVYELECFPGMELKRMDPKVFPPDFDFRHVISYEDLTSGLTFFHKLIGCSIYMQERFGLDYYEDLTDKDAHDVFYFWDTGVLGAKRPDRPPFVFLSYNRNNAEISKDVQTVLEDRGIYVWRAPKDVPLGQHYLPEEMMAIEDCDAFLILLSRPAQNSEEVKKEFVKALEIGKPILPIWVEDVPESEMNPYYKENLTKYQYRIMPKVNEEIIEEIVASVKRIASERK